MKGKEMEVPALKTAAGKEVYSRGLMLKVLEVTTETARQTPSTDSTASESGRSTPADQEEKPKVAKARTASMDVMSLTARAGTEARPRAWSEGAGMEATASPSSAPTTVMLRNIPNQYTRDKLCKRLDQQGFADEYDFLYLPIDRNSERNMGYAFINFRTVKACTEFARSFGGKLASQCLPGYKSNKVCEVRVAEVQGQDANLEKMTSPSFFQHLAEHEEWQPIFFDKNGVRMPLAARESTNEAGKRQSGKRPSSGTPAGASTDPHAVPSPKILPFMPPMMVPYSLPGLPMLEELPAQQVRAGGDLCAEAPEFVPSTCMGPVVPAPVDTATAMAVKHLEAEAAARAAAVAQARANAGRPTEMRKQIEYYFSVQNISHDMYLRSLMDESGWVNLEDIVNFPRLRALSADATSAAAALAVSESVELSKDGRNVRIKSPQLREAFPQEPITEPAIQEDPTNKNHRVTAAGG
eukprot:CAMPEP_0179154716 /NCGR_PEP_ID=MMETSP0796-20121207/75316_1 /TAXON_ID=73915 /ORGANISM="Pyrodinium bahamense, Strain pbaha01" /LENGTH=467 /DNA_ID=CAMNT_0020856121 /DNA_START=38 /DNA_END=1441 /DNA_ORIENTATION=-